MNNRPECIPCCLRRVLNTADRATSDEWLHRKILGEAMQELDRVDDMATPAEVIHSVFRRTTKTLGVPDPFQDEKRRWIEETTSNLEWIQEVIDSSDDQFLTALQLSLAANLLDCEFRHEIVQTFSLRSLVSGFQEVPFQPDNVEDFRQAVDGAEKILFLHATAGELVFDRLLIQQFGKPREQVFSTVRESPILAHATSSDADEVGLEDVANVVDPGIDCLGLPLSACSEEFRAVYEAADVIVAKGQALFETLEGDEARGSGGRKETFFLLRAKCAVVARQLGVAVGDSVLEMS